ASAGLIDATGVFTAPETEGTVTITVATPSQHVDVQVNVTLTTNAVPIASTGTVTTPSGQGSQIHGFYSDVQHEWWVLYTSSAAPTKVQTMHSTDFQAFTAGPSVDLNHAIGNGNNLAVAHRMLGDHEIMHVAQAWDQGFGRSHVRAELTSSGLVWGGAQDIAENGTTTPDGPAVAITEAGQVIDGTGYLQTPQNPPLTPCGNGDVVMYTANQLDDGTTSFDAMTYKQEVIWCVPTHVNARWLGTDGDTIYHLYDDGLTDPNTVNIPYQVRRANTWLPLEQTYTVPPSVFVGDIAFDIADWDATIVGRKLHAVRRNGMSLALEHRVLDLDGIGGFVNGGAMGSEAGVSGTGVIVAPYGTGVIAVQITATASAEPIIYAFYDGTKWTAWHTLDAPASAKRTGLSAIPGPRPALLWTEPGAASTLTGAALP
ncbi:MAG TPA: hypothetical protein VGC41_12805, partial [Kofleriaceae bacterium]